MFDTEAIFEVTIAIVLIWFGFPLEFYAELILVSVFVVVSEERCGYLCIVDQLSFACISL